MARMHFTTEIASFYGAI